MGEEVVVGASAANNVPSTDAEGDNRLALLRCAKSVCKVTKRGGGLHLLGTK